MRLPGYPEDTPLPARQTSGSAGFDVFAACKETLRLEPGDRQAVPTGLALAIPPGYEVQVRPRSGLALKHGIVLPNAPGTIDSDYRGELKVIMMNLGDEPFEIKAGDRIAQLIVSRVADADWEEADELDHTDRSEGGFGHTGV
ncbi:MAG: dUTP diphosphatase [bacterium]